VDAIPKTLIGKPLRRVLRETASAAPAEEETSAAEPVSD
jgi:acyl-coenzyme A synthetase/AMP-(fatty) acid ligase